MALTDPYGTDLAIDATGDLRVTASGSLAGVNGPYNCAQAVFLRLKTVQGDLALHPDYGSPIETTIVGSKATLNGIVGAVNGILSDLLNEDPRFATARIKTAAQPATTGQPGSTQISVQAQLSGGEQLQLGTTDPAPQDVSLPQIVSTADLTLELDPMAQNELFEGNDPTELDTLEDLNTQAWLTANTTIPTTTGG